MGSDDLFKKRREQRTSRKHDTKKPKPNTYLIVTEGERTEPLYFQGLTNHIKAQVGGLLEVVAVPHIEIHGEGRGTVSLILKTDEIVNRSKVIFQHVWIVFDKDDFADFDEAIALAKQRGYAVAWSNQCFEYWLYLHFNYSDSALHRGQWKEKLDQLFQAYGLGSGTYEKNDENIYALVNENHGVKTAIKNAKRRMADFEEGVTKPSTYDPGTTVHHLVSALQVYLEE